MQGNERIKEQETFGERRECEKRCKECQRGVRARGQPGGRFDQGRGRASVAPGPRTRTRLTLSTPAPAQADFEAPRPSHITLLPPSLPRFPHSPSPLHLYPQPACTMSDTEGGKKSGYRLEYASSGRSKCNGTHSFPAHFPVLVRCAHAAPRRVSRVAVAS